MSQAEAEMIVNRMNKLLSLTEWMTPKHVERRADIVMQLQLCSRAIAPPYNCPQCDPDVGFTCQWCAASYVMDDAARYLQAINNIGVL